jgi:hypothetical protein
VDEVLSNAGTATGAIVGAIIVAGALIGAGLYFGLRASPPVTVISSAPAGSAPPPASVAPATTPPPGIAPEIQQRVARESAAQLEALRRQLAERCWAPSVAASVEPASATFRVRLLFDAAGTRTQQGVSDASDPRRADVAACLRAQPMTVSVTAPGAIAGVDLALELP